MIEEINGIPAADHPLAPFLMEAGFYASAMGHLRGGTRDPGVPEETASSAPRKTLHRALAGKSVVRFESVFPHLNRVHDDALLTGRIVEGVRAAGKHVLMEFSGKARTHMRMNGSWHIYRPGETRQRPRHAMRIVIATADFVAVGFDIPVAEMIRAKELARHDELCRLGPDLLAETFDAVEAQKRIRARESTEIADVLLNQRVLAGIGNVYKSEVLFSCGINPFATVASLDDRQLECLVATARRFLRANVTDHLAAMTTYIASPNDTSFGSEGVQLGGRASQRSLPHLRNAHQDSRAGTRRATHLLVPPASALDVLTWIAIVVGASRPAAALCGYTAAASRLADGA